MTKTLKLLVCSGNLGNAEPDTNSLASWVPDDGVFSQVVENQKYPVVMDIEEFDYEESEHTTTSSVDEEQHDPENQFEKFDLIVFGMQEATFESKNEEILEEIKHHMEEENIALEEAPESAESIESVDTKRRESFSVQTVAKKAAKTGKKVAKSSADTVSKVAKSGADTVSKVTELTEKAARKGVSTVNTLAANRDNTKDKYTAELLADGTMVLHQLLQDRLPSYTRLLSFQRGEMRLLIYSLNRNHSASIKSVRAQNTGLAGLANKGGIVAEVIVDKSTVLSFMSCHLEAHEGLEKYATRCATVGDILKGTKKFAVPSIYPDVSLATHFCFVLGDLNFRTRYKGRVKYEEQIDDVNKLVLEKNWKELNEYDELRMALDNHHCLYGFKTPYCNFYPTFKVERGDGYVYKKNRTPSYTDRILWRTGDLLEKKVKVLSYEPIDNFVTSDHKPLRGAFEITLNHRVVIRPKHQMRTAVFHFRHENDPRDNLHLFVCDIQADLFPQENATSPPDSYVCLVSSPEEILSKKTNTVKQVYNAMKKFLRVAESNKVDIDSDASSKGWPRTGVIKSNYNPDWTNREIHCIMKTYRDDGFPIKLEGAILHIFVFKYSARQTDEVIGSYPVNLESIFRSCSILGSGTHTRSKSWRQSMRSSMRKSLSTMHLLPRQGGEAGFHDSHNNMVSVEINGPLLKNGMQTGVLRCTVDAWLVEDSLESAADAAAAAMATDPSQNGASSAADGSESSQAMFSSRHRRIRGGEKR